MYRKITALILLILCADMLYAGKFNRKVSRLMFTGTDNSLVFEMRLYYNEAGNLVKVKQFDHNMKFVGYEEYLYDSNNKKVRENIFNSRREQQKYTLIEYEKDKRVATTYNMDDAVILITETEYHGKGRVDRIVEYSSDRETAAVSTYSYRNNREVKCSRDVPVSGMSFYYIIRMDAEGILSSVEYFRDNGESAGYVRIILEDGIMTEQSLNDIMF